MLFYYKIEMEKTNEIVVLDDTSTTDAASEKRQRDFILSLKNMHSFWSPSLCKLIFTSAKIECLDHKYQEIIWKEHDWWKHVQFKKIAIKDDSCDVIGNSE